MTDKKQTSLCAPSILRSNIQRKGEDDMDTNVLLEDHVVFTQKDYDIMKDKNADYSDISDPFLNFRMVELTGAASVEQGIYARMMDKMMRLAKFVNGTTFEVKDEQVEDTLSDLRNYAIILQSYINRK